MPSRPQTASALCPGIRSGRTLVVCAKSQIRPCLASHVPSRASESGGRHSSRLSGLLCSTLQCSAFREPAHARCQGTPWARWASTVRAPSGECSSFDRRKAHDALREVADSLSLNWCRTTMHTARIHNLQRRLLVTSVCRANAIEREPVDIRRRTEVR